MNSLRKLRKLSQFWMIQKPQNRQKKTQRKQQPYLQQISLPTKQQQQPDKQQKQPNKQKQLKKHKSKKINLLMKQESKNSFVIQDRLNTAYHKTTQKFHQPYLQQISLPNKQQKQPERQRPLKQQHQRKSKKIKLIEKHSLKSSFVISDRLNTAQTLGLPPQDLFTHSSESKELLR